MADIWHTYLHTHMYRVGEQTKGWIIQDER